MTDSGTAHRASRRARIGLVILVAAGLLALMAWMTDFVTAQGEWTLYGATCEGGEWRRQDCSGTLRAGDRFRFRALKAHGEVLYWTVGAATPPSGKLVRCTIRDGRSWGCPAQAVTPAPVTFELREGEPVLDSTRALAPAHFVPKWRWILLRR